MSARWAETAALLALGWIVAGPLTIWLAKARCTAREPIASLVAWQAVGLSGGLAVLTAELTLAASNRAGAWHSAVAATLADPASVGPMGALGLVLFALCLVWLVGVFVISSVRVLRSRREHRTLIGLLARPETTPEGSFAIIDAAAPVAYALPGRKSQVVVSSGATETLTGAELYAVLAHERAHLRQRHSVLAQPFIAWQHSLPFLASPLVARRRVEELIEMVCDDTACRTAEPAALASALIALHPDERQAAKRLQRLRPAQPSPTVRLVLLVGAFLLITVPPAVLLALPL